MKPILIALSALVAIATTCSAYEPAQAGYGATIDAPTGYSSHYQSEDGHGNYQFGYDESHAYGGSSRREEGFGGAVRGSYSLSEADGRYRTVNYLADGTGFHADVNTNEPGLGPGYPADVTINTNGYSVVASNPARYAAEPAPTEEFGASGGPYAEPLADVGYDGAAQADYY